MESLRSWFTGVRKSQQHHQAETKDAAACLKPVVRKPLQPTRKTTNCVESNISSRTAFPIRNRGSVVPVKRPAEPSELCNELPPKLRKLQLEPSRVDGSGENTSNRNIEVGGSSTGSKRPWTGSCDDENHSKKKRRVTFVKVEVAKTVNADEDEGLLPQTKELFVDLPDESSGEEVVSNPEIPMHASQTDVPANNNTVHVDQKPELGSLVKALKSNASTALLNQARAHLKSSSPCQRSGLSRWNSAVELLLRKSNIILGSRKICDSGPDRIELPERPPGWCARKRPHFATATELTEWSEVDSESSRPTYRRSQLGSESAQVNRQIRLRGKPCMWPEDGSTGGDSEDR